jgi:D-alanyl-D-alanine carboxypeptidase
MRLIALILGAPGATTAQGSANREADAVAILDYGFNNFTPRTIKLPLLDGPRLWFTDEEEYIYHAAEIRLPLPTGLDGIQVEADLPDAVAAPAQAGTTIGYRYLRDPKGELIGMFPLSQRKSLELVQGAGYTLEMLKAKIAWILGGDLPIRFIPVE